MINPKYCNTRYFCRYRVSQDSYAPEIRNEFARIICGWDDGYDGFHTFGERIAPTEKIPVNERPVIPDPKDLEPVGPERNLVTDMWAALKKRGEIKEKITDLTAELRTMSVIDPRQCDKISEEIKKLEAEFKAIRLPRWLYIRPWIKEMFSLRSSEITERMAEVNCVRKDIYISANRYKIPMSFDSGNLLGYNVIVVSITCQCKNALLTEILEILKEFFDVALRDYFADCSNYMPNIINNTGNSLDLWYALKPIHAKCRNMYYGLANYLIEGLQKFIDGNVKEHPVFKLLKVTKTVTDCGTYRLPGSFNTTTGTWGDSVILHDERIDLAAEYNKLLHTGDVKAPQKKKQLGEDGKPKHNNFIHTAEERVDSLKMLLTYRHQRKFEEIPQRLTLLIAYCAFLTATGDKNNAECKARGFNQMFTKPLTDKELDDVISSARDLGGYKFKNETIIKWLKITEKEQDLINLHPVIKNPHDGSLHSTKKLDLDEPILAACAGGMNKKEIACAVGCSPQTVKRVLDKYNVKTLKEKLSDGICGAYERGWNVHKQEEKYGRTMSRGGKWYLKQKAANRIEQKQLKAEMKKVQKIAREEQKEKKKQEALIAEEKRKNRIDFKHVEVVNEDFLVRLFDWMSKPRDGRAA